MTPPVTQAEALGTMPLAAGEGARFFSPARFPGLDCLTATFRTHVYAPHTHETYVVGVIDAAKVEGITKFAINVEAKQ